jgi:ABC-type Zn uptake system ZnuABC Zn-binding protein ZnuA
MKVISLIFILNLCCLPAIAGNNISCSHAELCKMAGLIVLENKISDLKTETLINISGDPHEYEPTPAEVKNLISAPILLTGPIELNPWIKKINFQRAKSTALKTISIIFSPADYKLYPNASGEILSHFWLYPKVYCSLKTKLESELIKLNYKIDNKKICDSQTAEKDLQKTLEKSNSPIILTHDALLPLMLYLDKNKNRSIVAIKGSGHHEETGPQAIKKMYDALKAPQVIWIQEKNINIPLNILNKMRVSDKIIKLDTAQGLEGNPFSVITELSTKLKQLSEK